MLKNKIVEISSIKYFKIRTKQTYIKKKLTKEAVYSAPQRRISCWRAPALWRTSKTTGSSQCAESRNETSFPLARSPHTCPQNELCSSGNLRTNISYNACFRNIRSRNSSFIAWSMKLKGLGTWLRHSIEEVSWIWHQQKEHQRWRHISIRRDELSFAVWNYYCEYL